MEVGMERAIERIMRTCGPPQAWLAERMGCSEAQVSRLLNRRRRWTALRKRQAVEALREAAACILEPGGPEGDVEAYFEGADDEPGDDA
jgi:antitoxin component HigA of HigAB toxin-antitoxin module